jgi:hypothetical protein
MDEIDRRNAEKMVIALVGEKFSDKWWDSPNRAFNFLTPDEVWKHGDSKTVMQYLLIQCFGGAYS